MIRSVPGGLRAAARRVIAESLRETRKRPSRLVRRLAVERLESRTVLSAVEFTPLIVAGDPNGSPADSPANRVDANTTSSSFAGVGSLFMTRGGPVGYICTGTLIGDKHVVTAGHCLDSNNDGVADFKPGNVTFNINYGGNLTHRIAAAALAINPAYTGFAHPVVNDDIAVITLKTAAPAGAPRYSLHAQQVTAEQTLEMVGYGRSGDGVNGYTTNASLTVKRTGANNADAFEGQDDSGGPAANEVWLADFDGPSGDGELGGPTLGNDVETALGGGDSGGPSFVWNATTAKYELAAINTFSFEGDGYNTAPFFGSGLGGILVHPYLDWIAGVLSGSGGGGGGGGNNGGKGGGKPNSSQEIVDWAIPPLQASPSFSSGAASEALHSESSDGQLDADVAIVEPAAVRVVSDRPSVVITSTDRHDERNEGAEEADTLAALDFIFANSLFT